MILLLWPVCYQRRCIDIYAIVKSIILHLIYQNNFQLCYLWYCHGPLSIYEILRVAHAPGIPETFSPPPPVSDLGMHHGTCVTHVPWCMPGSLAISFEVGGGENLPGIPSACATHNFTYLARGPWLNLNKTITMNNFPLNMNGSFSMVWCLDIPLCFKLAGVVIYPNDFARGYYYKKAQSYL